MRTFGGVKLRSNVKWFGKGWGAPITYTCDHAPTPVGEPCMRCELPIRVTDNGLLIPSFEQGVWMNRPWHKDCFLAEVLGEERISQLKEEKHGDNDGSN